MVSRVLSMIASHVGYNTDTYLTSTPYDTGLNRRLLMPALISLVKLIYALPIKL